MARFGTMGGRRSGKPDLKIDLKHGAKMPSMQKMESDYAKIKPVTQMTKISMPKRNPGGNLGKFLHPKKPKV